MMSYYILKNDLNDKILGKDFSQVGFMNPSGQTLSSWKFPPCNTMFEIELNEKSQLTDFLKSASISARGFILSETVNEILKSFNIMTYKSYPVKVEFKSDFYNFFWLHLLDENLINHLDYNKSIFYKTEYTFRDGTIVLKSYEEYKKLKSKDKMTSFGVSLDKISLSDMFDTTLDLFTFLPFDNNIYISEKLKDKLEFENISGITMTKALNFI